MAQTGEPKSAHISRRTLLAGMAAAPAVGVTADPDTALALAWDGLRTLEQQMDDGAGDIADEQAEHHARLEHLIARTPCHGITGLRVKLHLLTHLYETNGTQANWELDLCRTVLNLLASGEMA